MPFELVPQKLVYGGAALGHAQGRTVLVPFALPGERLEVESLRTAKGVVHARPVRVLEAASQRVLPPCPYFTRCGGCHYQHLAAEYQAAAKVEILRETLRRLGKIVWDSEIPIHAAHPWNYRNQAQLKVARMTDGHVGLGFFEAQSHRLFPVDECLILSPRLNAVLAELRGAEWAHRLAGLREIEMLADDRDEHVMMTLHGGSDSVGHEALAREILSRLSGVASVAVHGKRGFRIFGEPALQYAVGEFRYQVSPGSFFQASRFLLPELVNAATKGESGALALDIFAGVGLLTLPLAREFERVVAVEAHPGSAMDLEANAKAHGCDNVRVARKAAHDFLRRFAQTEPDLVVLDPPRAGVGVGTLKLLVGSLPRRIYYVSCSPPTLARDLGYLLARGYTLNSVELFEFFPQTYHIECLAKLTRQHNQSY
ncbi:MAG: 23S rRNA (uracil(1939)-C(5))-methyltransferase RlmD [Acidobacteria bacterium]|nr:23S rRNA (uracil(1939)-C(5))-methyltransferase RlmD [Acidobacteriota bacterium]